MKISVTEAARMIGASPEYVRYGLRTKQLPIGSAVQMSSRWTYNISEGLLMKYLGKEDKNDDTDI